MVELVEAANKVIEGHRRSTRRFQLALVFIWVLLFSMVVVWSSTTTPQKKQFRILEAVKVKAEMEDGGQVELDLPVGCVIVVHAHKSKEEFAMGGQ